MRGWCSSTRAGSSRWRVTRVRSRPRRGGRSVRVWRVTPARLRVPVGLRPRRLDGLAPLVMVDGVEAFGVTRARDDALCVRCEQFDGEWELRGRRVPAMCSLCVCALVVDGLMAAEVKGS